MRAIVNKGGKMEQSEIGGTRIDNNNGVVGTENETARADGAREGAAKDNSNNNEKPAGTANGGTAPNKPGVAKGLIAGMILCAVLGLAGVGFGVWGVIQAQNKSGQSSGETTQTEQNTSQTEGGTEQQGGGTESAGETEITDGYMLNDLNEMLVILHAVADDPENAVDNDVIVLRAGTHPEFPLYQHGGLTVPAKLARTIESLRNYTRDSYNHENKIIMEDHADKLTGWDLSRNSVEVIDADVVKKKYHDLFGEDLDLNADFSQYCPSYVYNARLNMFVNLSACGGTSDATTWYYKEKYTTDGDHASVYVRAATASGQEMKVLCDVAVDYKYDAVTDCSEKYAYDGFELNQTNYQDFAQYRFVFKKAGDGTYYFERVEKV